MKHKSTNSNLKETQDFIRDNPKEFAKINKILNDLVSTINNEGLKLPSVLSIASSITISFIMGYLEHSKDLEDARTILDNFKANILNDLTSQGWE